MTFQILEKFKNTLIKNKVEESVYQISRLIKKLELSTVCSIAEGQTHGKHRSVQRTQKQTNTNIPNYFMTNGEGNGNSYLFLPGKSHGQRSPAAQSR